jgi:L-alanine-DL-glutamate epimerase-like enolase superfamily enzyme
VVGELLEDTVTGRDAFDVAGAAEAMARQVRNVGRPGIAAMAISAADIALWDLKARLLGASLVGLLGRVHDGIPVYGSGGFTSYPHDRSRRFGRGGCVTCDNGLLSRSVAGYEQRQGAWREHMSAAPQAPGRSSSMTRLAYTRIPAANGR